MTADEVRAKALLERYAHFLGQHQLAMERWANALAFQVRLGVARCADLEMYNQAATAMYSQQIFALALLREGGVAPHLVPSEPPMPPLFALEATVFLPPGQIFPQFDLKMACTSTGLAASGVQQRFPSVCTPNGQVIVPDSGQSFQGVLGAGIVGACLFGPVACSLVLVSVGVGVAVGSHYFFKGASHFVRTVLNAEGELNRQMQAKTAEQEAARATAISDCFKGFALTLIGLAPVERDAAAQRIRRDCAALFPVVKAPPAAKSFLLTALPMAFVVGGTLIAYNLTHPRRGH